MTAAEAPAVRNAAGARRRVSAETIAIIGVGVALLAVLLSVRADVAELRTELRADMAELRTELRADMAELRTGLRADMAEVRADVAEVRRDLRDLGERVARIEGALTAAPRVEPEPAP